MRPSNSLRFRVAVAFAAFGALLSILLFVGLYTEINVLGHNLMDEALRAELDDSVARHDRNKEFVPPNTVSIKGFFVRGEEAGQFAPPGEIRKLQPGSHNVTVDEIDYRVLVADRNGFRYFMLFDTDRQHEQEEELVYYLSWFAVLTALLAAAGGWWLAVHIITPVTRLAHQVGHAGPDDMNLPLEKFTRDDEVGELARAFKRYFNRMQDFVKRENYFTADVSHELRTPLGIIQGTVEVLEMDGTLSEAQQKRMHRIKLATRDMTELTSTLLLLAHEYQHISERPPLSLNTVAQACIEKHRHLIDQRAIRLELELTDEPYINVERPLLEIVIGNLLRNAFFNTRSGVVTVRVEADKFLVKDTGLGIPAEVMAQVFERYHKGVESSGAGVGLSLVKRICDRYGWRVAIASTQGQGTTVEVVFSV